MEKLGVIREDVTPVINEEEDKQASADKSHELDNDFRKQAAEAVCKKLK